MLIALGSGRLEFESGPQLTLAAGGGAAIPDGLTFKISGTTFEFNSGGPPVQLGNVEIAYTAADSVSTIGAKIVAAVNPLSLSGITGTVVASPPRDRVAFLNTTPASTDLSQFTALPGFVASGATGVSGTNEPIKFLLSDTAEQLAARIVNAVQNAGIPNPNGSTSTVDAFASGNSVRFSGAKPTYSAGSPWITYGIPTSNTYGAVGNITGLASLPSVNFDGQMYAISDSGALYRVNGANLFFEADDSATITFLSKTNYRSAGQRPLRA